MELLLSSSAYPIPDRLYTSSEVVEDIDRLNRKVTPYLPEVRLQPKRKRAKPLLCPLTFNPQSRFIICW